MLADQDAIGLRRAETILESLLEQQRARLLATVQILADDTRIRSTAMTTGFDETTIRDVLDDLKKASKATVLGVLDEGGKVRAITGAEGLRQMDLGSSPVIKAAQEHPASSSWVLPDKVLIIGVAPIRAGPRVSALLLMGLSLGKEQLAAIQNGSGVMAAIFNGDTLIASSADGPGIPELFRAAQAGGSADVRLVPGQPGFIGRVTRTNESATAAKLVWVAPRQQQTERLLLLRNVSWLPALFALMTFGLALFLTRNRNGGRS
ncbi:MAG TPA: cache domain-containing protein [Polyangia bacterium]|nr:cache domain-containing protein [Polyangia bacterium]